MQRSSRASCRKLDSFASLQVGSSAERGEAKLSQWTHNICGACWNAKPENKDRQFDAAARGGQGPPDVCCWCGAGNRDGIYLRASPEELKCRGNHAKE